MRRVASGQLASLLLHLLSLQLRRRRTGGRGARRASDDVRGWLSMGLLGEGGRLLGRGRLGGEGLIGS